MQSKRKECQICKENKKCYIAAVFDSSYCQSVRSKEVEKYLNAKQSKEK